MYFLVTLVQLEEGTATVTVFAISMTIVPAMAILIKPIMMVLAMFVIIHRMGNIF